MKNKTLFITFLLVVMVGLVGYVVWDNEREMKIEQARMQNEQTATQASSVAVSTIPNTNTKLNSECVDAITPSLTLLSPNEGTFSGSTQIPITWTSCNIPSSSNVDIIYEDANHPGDGGVISPIAGYPNTGSAEITLPYVGSGMGDVKVGPIYLKMLLHSNKEIYTQSAHALYLTPSNSSEKGNQ